MLVHSWLPVGPVAVCDRLESPATVRLVLVVSE